MQVHAIFFAVPARDHQPALLGRHVSCGFRQSIPSNMYAICAAVIDTAPPDADGQMNVPRSNRLA